MIKHLRYILYLYVFTGFISASAGSYDDFFRAIKRDDAEEVLTLLRRGFDANTIDPQLRHGLLIALDEPSERVLEVLLSWPGTKVDERTPQGETPLMIAALRGNLVAARKLMARDADVNKPGWTPLHYAATNGHLDMMKLLLEHHAYIDAESPNGSTPLMMAAQYANAQTVQLLLDAGADPQIKNQQQLSAMDFAHRASRDDSAELIAAAIRAKQYTGKW